VRIFIGFVAAATLLFGSRVLAAETTELGYDPRADAFAVRDAAVARAAALHKLVLLVAGGDWCVWCHYLAAFLEHEPAIDAQLHDVFVVAKVYVGSDNDNAEFFATLPKAAGAPHFWVVSAQGEVLDSQNTLPLEDGAKSYDPAAFTAFIERWRSRARH
jgi:thiol:disulfide interchange protein